MASICTWSLPCFFLSIHTNAYACTNAYTQTHGGREHNEMALDQLAEPDVVQKSQQLRRQRLALGFLAVHSVLALQFKRGAFLTPGDRMIREVFKRFGSCTVVWKRILLKAILLHMGVRAWILLDSVHSLVIQFWGPCCHRHGYDGLQRLVPTCRWHNGKRLDDSDGG